MWGVSFHLEGHIFAQNVNCEEHEQLYQFRVRQRVDLGAAWGYLGTPLGNRLTVDPQTLTLLVLVRIQVPQPDLLKASGSFVNGVGLAQELSLRPPLNAGDIVSASDSAAVGEPGESSPWRELHTTLTD